MWVVIETINILMVLWQNKHVSYVIEMCNKGFYTLANAYNKATHKLIIKAEVINCGCIGLELFQQSVIFTHNLYIHTCIKAMVNAFILC